MAHEDYIKKDLAGFRENAKYPPNYEKYGDEYYGYKNAAEEVLFYDFAVLNYDLYFTYKGKPYHFLTETDHVAYCDEHYTEEYQVFPSANELIEQFAIDGKPLIELIDELEDVEPI